MIACATSFTCGKIAVFELRRVGDEGIKRGERRTGASRYSNNSSETARSDLRAVAKGERGLVCDDDLVLSSNGRVIASQCREQECANLYFDVDALMLGVLGGCQRAGDERAVGNDGEGLCLAYGLRFAERNHKPWRILRFVVSLTIKMLVFEKEDGRSSVRIALAEGVGVERCADRRTRRPEYA